MQKYNIDKFGWPHKKIKFKPPQLLYNKEIIFIPKIFKRKISYCVDVKKGETLTGWYIDKVLGNFTFKNIIKLKNISLPITIFNKLIIISKKIIKYKKTNLKKNEIILFGPYSDAYAHQLHEFIIRLLYINNSNLKKNKILLDQNLKKILNSKIFKYIFKNLNISFYKNNENIIFQNVNYLTHIENRFKNKILDTNVRLIRKKCFEYFKINKIKISSPKYVLASRKKAKRRHLLNEDKLFKKLSKFGFQRIYFEDLSFENQIYLSLNAKILVGYHGTAFTNAGLFMDKKTHIIEIMHEKYPQGHGKLFCQIQGSINKRVFCEQNFNNLDGICNENKIVNYIKKII